MLIEVSIRFGLIIPRKTNCKHLNTNLTTSIFLSSNAAQTVNFFVFVSLVFFCATEHKMANKMKIEYLLLPATIK